MTFLTALFLGIILIVVFGLVQVAVAFLRVAILVAYGKDLAQKYQAAKAQQTVDTINQAFKSIMSSTRENLSKGIDRETRRNSFEGKR